MAVNSLQEIKSSTVSPAFLHANSTIHTTPFSAIAELIDNAYDPDSNATELCIETKTINEYETLCFADNGKGMNHEKLCKMLSFGYSEKIKVGSRTPIGFYGNGFKSGSMRLGSDALVLTRCTSTTSVGFLSQTYLKAINADEVKVPIVTWDNKYPMTRKPDMQENLNAIQKHSIFKSDDVLFEMLTSLGKKHRTGTTIIIFNLRRDHLGTNELDFVSDPEDIRNPGTTINDLSSINRPIQLTSAEHKRSLREFCSILYLIPRMKIVLRGVKVQSRLISKSLSQTEYDVYKPTWLTSQVKLTFGFTNSKDTDCYGMMLYHKNRLIKAYEKVGCQTKANEDGVGVVGVVEANFLEPVHDKQDFVRNDRYKSFIENCGKKLNDYYYEKTQGENPGDSLLSSDPWTWVQCDNCQKWRRLPTGYSEQLPDKWFCKDNPDASFNRCEIPMEPEDDDEALKVSYKKTYQKNQREKKRRAVVEQGRASRIVDSAGPSTSSVCTRSRTTLRAPIKRKIEVLAKSPSGKNVKKIKQAKITTLSLENNDSVSELTPDEAYDEITVTTYVSDTEMSQNVCVERDDSTEIEANIEADNIELAGASYEKENALAENLAHKGSQTEPISTEEGRLLELRKMLSVKNKELDECHKNLKRLQDNISYLLRLIEPGIDCGRPENIENVINDFIREISGQHDS